MSIAQGTTHYDYPQVQLTDRPTFADFNPAFNDIDAKLYGLITGASTDHAAIEALQTGLGETNTLLATVKNTADGAKSKADTNEENIGILTTALSNTNRTVATKLDSVAIAEPYDPDAGTYAVGDVVVYNGQRYKCTTDVAVAEPFDADKWTGEDVETVLDVLATKGTIVSLGSVTGNTDFELPSQYLNSNYEIVVSVVFNSIVYAEFRVQGNEVYRANMVMGGYANASFNRYIELYGHDGNQIRINGFYINGTDERANITVYIGARKLA